MKENFDFSVLFGFAIWKISVLPTSLGRQKLTVVRMNLKFFVLVDDELILVYRTFARLLKNV